MTLNLLLGHLNKRKVKTMLPILLNEMLRSHLGQMRGTLTVRLHQRRREIENAAK
jgi:hypothetical protein